MSEWHDVPLILPKKLQFLLRKHTPYKVAYGGRGSAKSWSFARALLARGGSGKERILCVRETQEAIADSVHALLSDQILALNLSDHYQVLTQEIRGPGKTTIGFAGIRSDPAKIKGFEGCTICWVEEAEAVSEQSWQYLIPTIFRTPGAELWISFNPRWRSDATWQRFAVNPPTDAIVVKINYTDNPWFPAGLERERRDDLEKRGLATYNHVWLGECGVTGECYFAQEVLGRVRAHLRPPLARGVLEQAGQDVRWIAREDGWLLVWTMPTRGQSYVVGGDVSKGKSTGDQHSADVIHVGVHAAEQVAHLAPQCRADEYARRCVLTAQWYGGSDTAPWVGLERNGIGEAACIAAEETKYPALYRAPDGDVGLFTSATNRQPVLLADLDRGLGDGHLVVRHAETWDQLSSFCRTPAGRPEAAPGAQDDKVMGLAIAYHLAQFTKPQRRVLPGQSRSGAAKCLWKRAA